MQSYSADEIMAILDRAAELQVRFIKVPGFEATRDVGSRAPAAAASAGDKKKSPKADKPTNRLEELGRWVMPIGRDYKGRPLSQILPGNLRSFIEDYLAHDDDLSDSAKLVVKNGREYLKLLEEHRRQA